jgi:hypothetical protein
MSERPQVQHFQRRMQLENKKKVQLLKVARPPWSKAAMVILEKTVP